eukprot:3480297-Rhodomonas_salina.7
MSRITLPYLSTGHATTRLQPTSHCTVMFLNKPPPVGSVLYRTGGGLISEHHGMPRANDFSVPENPHSMRVQCHAHVPPLYRTALYHVPQQRQ